MQSTADAAWHTLPLAQALSIAGSRTLGLTEAEAADRLQHYGPNRLTPPRPVSAWKILRDQVTSVVVLLLFAAAIVSVMLGDIADAIAIAVVLVINTTIGFVTEWRARRAMEALQQLDTPQAAVVRDGHLRLIDAERLVPGDVVEVTAGHSVPADARLLVAHDLRVNEAALTGESLPISKLADPIFELETDLADRRNMVFKGTIVTVGFGRAVISATGCATEVGRIGELTGRIEEERTPLERRLDVLGRRLVWLTLGIAALVGALAALHGAPLGLVVETAIALAVAAVPEALPAVVTIALAVGMRRMARRHALVRRLPAVETLGSTTVICTDKTRTLTSGDMTVVRVCASGREWDPSDLTVEPDADLTTVLHSAALASRPQADETDQVALRDPVDAAILNCVERISAQSPAPINSRQVGIIPFTSMRKWMAGFYQGDAGALVFVKGAPSALMARCSTVLTMHGLEMLDDAERAALTRVNDRLAEEGLRVLGVASGSVPYPAEDAIEGLTFVGFIGLADPPAPGVRETIDQLRGAGLRTVMLTGDQRLTAISIGRSLGLLDERDRGLDGRDLERLAEADKSDAIGRTSVFSRVTPEHKLTVISALQARGEIVAMLGDGINDAAALKKADVGVAMGVRGTDIAKDAASIVLEDDRFETIAAAVEEGRIIFDNIRKFVFYLFSCNVAEVLVLLIAGLFSLPLPLAPLQLLWLNMVTDTFPALALALEPGDEDVMRRPPRDPQEAILSFAFLASVAGFGLLITAATMAAFGWALWYAPEHASTIAFMTLALAQIAHLGNARSADAVMHPRQAASNPYALLGVGVALLLQTLAAFVMPLAHALQVTAVQPTGWAVILVFGSLPAVIGQLMKTMRRSRARS